MANSIFSSCIRCFSCAAKSPDVYDGSNFLGEASSASTGAPQKHQDMPPVAVQATSIFDDVISEGSVASTERARSSVVTSNAGALQKPTEGEDDILWDEVVKSCNVSNQEASPETFPLFAYHVEGTSHAQGVGVSVDPLNAAEPKYRIRINGKPVHERSLTDLVKRLLSAETPKVFDCEKLGEKTSVYFYKMEYDAAQNNQVLAKAYHANSEDKFYTAIEKLDPEGTCKVDLGKPFQSLLGHVYLANSYRTIGLYDKAIAALENAAEIVKSVNLSDALSESLEIMVCIHNKMNYITKALSCLDAEDAEDDEKCLKHFLDKIHYYDRLEQDISRTYSNVSSKPTIMHNVNFVPENLMGVSDNEPIGTRDLHDCVAVSMRSEGNNLLTLCHTNVSANHNANIEHMYKLHQDLGKGNIEVRLFGAAYIFEGLPDDGQAVVSYSRTNTNRVLKCLAHMDIDVLSCDLGKANNPHCFVVNPSTHDIEFAYPALDKGGIESDYFIDSINWMEDFKFWTAFDYRFLPGKLLPIFIKDYNFLLVAGVFQSAFGDITSPTKLELRSFEIMFKLQSNPSRSLGAAKKAFTLFKEKTFPVFKEFVGQKVVEFNASGKAVFFDSNNIFGSSNAHIPSDNFPKDFSEKLTFSICEHVGVFVGEAAVEFNPYIISFLENEGIFTTWNKPDGRRCFSINEGLLSKNVFRDYNPKDHTEAQVDENVFKCIRTHLVLTVNASVNFI